MIKNIKSIKKTESRGITLIALVITIIVLLILVAVSIATLTGENGILTRLSDAKIETAIGAVKENLKLEQIEKAIDEVEVTPETLLAEGKVKRTVQQGEDENYYMYYALKEGAVEGMQELGKGNVASLRDVFLIDDKLNVKYIASNGKEYGDELEEKTLEDETEIRFASKAFSEYVSKISGVTEEEMKFKWMKNQTKLTIDDPSIDSLEDLIFFPNLTSISMSKMKLSKLDGIENCKKLKGFSVVDVQIENYESLSLLENIETIYIQGAGSLKDLENFIDSIKNFKRLTKLSLYATNLKDIALLDALKNVNTLKYLNLGVNKIENLNPLKNLTHLETLDLRNNLISDVSPLKTLVKLKSLDLNKNNIIDVTPLAYNTNLISLNLKNNYQIDGNRNNYEGEKLEALNKIGEILDKGGTIYLDIDKLGLFANYKSLDLSGQHLTTLEPLEGLTQLIELNLTYNQLTLEDEKSQKILASMQNLETLYLNDNSLTNISAINNMKNLKLLYIEGNEQIDLSQIEDIISNLNNLRLGTNALKTIKNCSPEKIQKLNIDYSAYLTEIPDLSIFTNLKTLSLRSLRKVNDFSSISNLNSLNNLYLSGNDLRDKLPDFSKLSNLQGLYLSSCSLWSEDLEKLKVLRNNSNLIIDLDNNSIIDATALLELNPNTKINLSGNVNLSQDSKDKLKARFGNNVKF